MSRLVGVVPSDLVEEICLRLPLKSILKFKSVSKEWRSMVESRNFAERRRKIMNTVQKMPQILAAAGNHRSVRRLNEDEEKVEIFYLHCDAAATQPSLTCDGLVCIPVPGCINVLNPSTGELLRFPSGPDPVKTDRYDRIKKFEDTFFDCFPGYWAMGFGRDEVNGSYKVVKMFYDTRQIEILDINIGEWRIPPSPPPYHVEARRKSACVNGSIYWLQYIPGFQILALDLHTEEFRDVPPPLAPPEPGQLVNLEGRLAMAITDTPPHHWELKIWMMDAKEQTWSKTYTIRLFSRYIQGPGRLWCRPVAVSKEGYLYFYDSVNRLFKFYPETQLVQCISSNIRVLSSFVENMLPLRRQDSAPAIRTFGFRYLMPDGISKMSSRISKMFRRFELQIPDILITTMRLL